MRDEARRIYARARQFRVAAKTACDESSRKFLLQMADELEAEGRKIEEAKPEPR